MQRTNSKRLHIKYERGLSFEDMKKQLPAVETKHGVYNDITKLTLMVDLYDPKIVTELYFDEGKSNFVYDKKYNTDISHTLGHLYKQRMVNLGSLMEIDTKYTYNDMIISLIREMEEAKSHII